MNAHEATGAGLADAVTGDATRRRPPQVVLALTLQVAALVAAAVAMAISWDHLDIMESTARVVVTLTLTLLAIVWILYKIYVGRNWARILYLILSIPLPMSFLNESADTLIREAPLLVTATRIINTCTTMAVLWLLFTRPGSLWFRSARRASVPAVRHAGSSS